MKISFDPVKHATTLQARGLDFADAAIVFSGPVFTFEDTRIVYPERRFATYGLIGDRLVAVIWTETRNGRRVISMRKANDREHTRYRHRLA